MDDIICNATEAEHDARLRQVLKILQEYIVVLNKSNSVLNIWGEISGEGIKPPKKSEAVVNLPSPKSIGEVQSFVGMVTFNSKLIRAFFPEWSVIYH